MDKKCESCGKKMILWFHKERLLFRDDYLYWRCGCGFSEGIENSDDAFNYLWEEINK